MGRKNYKKRKTKLIHIFCEGKSQDNYFKQFIAFERIRRANVQIKNSKKTDSLGMINEVISFQKSKNSSDGDEIFCVFDIDNTNQKTLRKAVDLSKKHKIKLITSNPCFEYWILCHFEKYSHPIKSNEIITKLKKKFKRYKKGDPELYNSIRGKTNEAIKNVKSTIKDLKKKKKKNQNPHTKIHELIQHLHSF